MENDIFSKCCSQATFSVNVLNEPYIEIDTPFSFLISSTFVFAFLAFHSPYFSQHFRSSFGECENFQPKVPMERTSFSSILLEKLSRLIFCTSLSQFILSFLLRHASVVRLFPTLLVGCQKHLLAVQVMTLQGVQGPYLLEGGVGVSELKTEISALSSIRGVLSCKALRRILLYALRFQPRAHKCVRNLKLHSFPNTFRWNA